MPATGSPTWEDVVLSSLDRDFSLESFEQNLNVLGGPPTCWERPTGRARMTAQSAVSCVMASRAPA